MALTDKLAAIGNAIRAKTGGTEKLTLDQMPGEIASITTGGGFTDEQLTFSGNCSYLTRNEQITNLIFTPNNMKRIKFENVQNMGHMFHNYKGTDLSGFSIPSYDEGDSSAFYCLPWNNDMFADCNNLKYFPKIIITPGKPFGLYSLSRMFQWCHCMRELPEFMFKVERYTDINDCDQTFSQCYSLRSLGTFDLSLINTDVIWYKAAPITRNAFYQCSVLEEIKNVKLVNSITLDNNGGIEKHTKIIGSSFVEGCSRLKTLTFCDNPDAKIADEVLDLSDIGYVYNGNSSSILNYNSGITANKEVIDNATYQALKNDPDWFTCNKAYSRYNKTSEIETISTLPDMSSYGFTNTIKFKGASGSATDGGAINTMSEEQIAVATAKGWTVSYV